MTMVDVFGSATIEEAQLALEIATSGNEELLEEAPENVSRAKVRIMAAHIQNELLLTL